MMLNIIASYNKLLYAMKNTLYKIRSRINFAETHHFEIYNFAEYRKFWKFCWGEEEEEITILSHCVEIFVRWITFLSHSAETFERLITFCLTESKNFVGYPSCIPNFLNSAAVFLFKVIVCEFFDLCYLTLSAPIVQSINKLE